MRHRRSTAWMIWLLLFLWHAAPGMGADICGHPQAGRVEIIRGDAVVAEVEVALAATIAQRRQGLMHCARLAQGTGMLFTYPDARKRVFWMKDTLVELAIVFISDEGRIAAIAHGEPGSLKRIHSPQHIASVLEINWTERHALAVGDRVRPVLK